MFSSLLIMAAVKFIQANTYSYRKKSLIDIKVICNKSMQLINIFKKKDKDVLCPCSINSWEIMDSLFLRYIFCLKCNCIKS